MNTEHFDDEEFVENYIANGPVNFVPGFESMHLMVGQLISEVASDDGSILILGAGGGHELVRLSEHNPKWRFCAVDPSNQMLSTARFRMEKADRSPQVEWVEGTIEDAPLERFDAATCLLTMHFVPDDGGKLNTLKAIRSRLKKRGRLILVDLCMDLKSPGFEQDLQRYASYALASGAAAKDVEEVQNRIGDGILSMATPERNHELAEQAGFTDVQLFYAGHAWRGWSMDA